MKTISFYSHLEKDEQGNIIFSKKLWEHLKEVGLSAQNFIANALPKDYAVQHLAYVTGLAHDFGKYTSYFQDYLLNGNDTGSLKNHSLLSAFWGAFLVFREKNDAFIETLLVFNVILNHHGNLENISTLLRNLDDLANPFLKDMISTDYQRKFTLLFEKHLPALEEQSEFIDQDLKNVNTDLPSVQSFFHAMRIGQGAFYQFLIEANNHYQKLLQDQNCQEFNFKRLILFSALIDADKRDAGQIQKEIQRHSIPDNIVRHYVKRILKSKPSPLSLIRDRLFNELQEQAYSVNLDQYIFTLTAPTGSGKTLSVLNFALVLKKRLQKERNRNPRIIYVLPFTSIIDQNFEVFKQVIRSWNSQLGNDSSLLLKHHHLSEIDYHTGDEAFPLDQSLLLTESWESEIVVTTFVQFFESIISNRNKMLKKYHNIFDSLVILDEVQNIPLEYWPLVREVLNLLSGKAHSYFILMTATQPLIFPEQKTIELVKSKNILFEQLNRVRINHNPQSLQLSDFAHEFLNTLDEQKSYAVILNTIQSSIEFFKLAEQNLSTGHRLFYLSTNIVPLHRQQRIAEINAHLKRGTPLILVSTQVIEAGIDFDFDVIYRDFAPVDSLVQAAGRANRNGSKAEGGEVHLVHLVNKKERSYAHFIYGKAHLFVANKLFEQVTQLPEKTFRELVKQNYEQLIRICDMSLGEKIFQKWWRECNDNVLSEFRLIDEKLNYVNVFVSVDEQAQEIWERFITSVYREKDIRQRRLNFLKMRKEFNQFVISIPASLAKKHFWDYSNKPFQGIGYIALEMADDYYNFQTGFIRQTDDGVLFL